MSDFEPKNYSKNKTSSVFSDGENEQRAEFTYNLDSNWTVSSFDADKTSVIATNGVDEQRAVVTYNLNGGSGGSDSHNMGWFADETALVEAHPTAENGDYAIVGTTDTVWVWDSDSSSWVDTGVEPTVYSAGQGIIIDENNVISTDQSLYMPKKIANFLYYVDVDPIQQDEEYAISYFEDNYHNKDTSNVLNSGLFHRSGACTSIRKSNLYGRNYDWNYNNDCSFIVHNSAKPGKHASIGMSSLKLTESDINSKTWNEKIKLIPYCLLDGINDSGLICSINVVPAGDWGKTIGTHSEFEGPYYCMLMLPKIILERFTTASEAAQWLVNDAKVYAPYNNEYKEEIHFMIADSNETYIVEFLNNVAKSTLVTDKRQILTNYYIENTSYDSDGYVDFNSTTPYAQGLERFNLAVSQYSDIANENDMREVMESLKYTNAYDNTISPYWKTEFAAPYADMGYEYPNLTAQDPLQDYIDCGLLSAVQQLYAERSRSTGLTWQTVHSSVYNMGSKSFSVRIQESEKDYYVTFNGLGKELWESGTGVSSIQMSNSNSQAEGNYSLAEGYGNIAMANNSHAEGNATKVFAEATGAHAEGIGNIARGSASHVEGQQNESIGDCSHAEGGLTYAGGDFSHAEGNSTITNNYYEHAEGHFNVSNKSSNTYGDSGNTIHSIGIGSGLQDKKNATEVMQNGDLYILGIGNYDGTNISSAETVQDVIDDLQNTNALEITEW